MPKRAHYIKMAWTQWSMNLRIGCATLFVVFVCLIRCVEGQTVCEFPSSCKPGDLVSDPADCQFYFVCSSDGTTFKRRRCDKDRYYDTGTNRCRIQRNAKCATVCDSEQNIFNELDNSNDDVPVNLMSDDNEELLGLTEKKEITGLNLTEDTVSELGKSKKANNQSVTVVADASPSSRRNSTTAGPSSATKATNMNATMPNNMSPMLNNTTTTSSTVVLTEVHSTVKAGIETTIVAVKETTLLPAVNTTAGVILPEVTTLLPAAKTTAGVVSPEVTTEVRPGNVSVAGVATEGPPYHVITGADGTEQTTAAANTTGLTAPASGGLAPAMIGVIVGVVIGLLVLVLLIVLIIILCRRRRNRNRHDIPKIENPQYTAAAASKPTNYRFSRNSALYVGPTVNFTKMKSTPQDEDSLTRKKRPAPAVPSARQHLLRKKGQAPPPPLPFGETIEEEFHPEREDRPLTDIYEKDSATSAENLEMSTFTAKNDTAVMNNSAGEDQTPENHTKDTEDVKQPLLSSRQSKTENEVTGSPSKDVIRNGGIVDNTTADQEELNNNNTEEDEEDALEQNGLGNDPIDTMHGQKTKGASRDNVSEDIFLDDYDKTYNPFFSS